MTWIVANIRWIMIVSGVLTASMVYAALAPQAALDSTFGETLDGPLAEIVVRNWGALIAMVGGMLIYGAFDPPGRPLILIVAGASKATFIGLVLSQGERYLGHQAGIAVGIDLVMIVIVCLVFVGRAWGPGERSQRCVGLGPPPGRPPAPKTVISVNPGPNGSAEYERPVGGAIFHNCFLNQ